jgi:hypothetical protein
MPAYLRAGRCRGRRRSRCTPSPGALAAAARKAAGFLAPALQAITRHLIAAGVVHFDETGFRTVGKLAWVHSASAGQFALFTVHAKRGEDGMKSAGVLPSFAGIGALDALTRAFQGQPWIPETG